MTRKEPRLLASRMAAEMEAEAPPGAAAGRRGVGR